MGIPFYLITFGCSYLWKAQEANKRFPHSNSTTMRIRWKDFVEAIRGGETDFTSGSVRRAIFLLSVPMILEMSMESLFAVVDAYFVGQVSVDALATLGLTESVMFLVYSLAIGLSMAVTAMVARRIGEKNPEGAAKVAGQSIYLALGLSLLVAIPGYIFAADILKLMGGDSKMIESGLGYTQIMFGGNATAMLLFLLNAVFRGAGNATLAMYSLWLANAINIVLDPCLILGLGPFPELGVAGAAVATNIGRGTGVVFQLIILLGGRSLIPMARDSFRFHFDVMKKLFMVSLGGMGQYLVNSASWIFLVRIIAQFGSAAVAGYTIAIRVIIFTILPSWGIASASATLVGQNLGAGKPDRAEQSVWLAAFYNMVFLVGVGLIFAIGAEFFVRIFNEEPEVVKIGRQSLQVLCASYVFFAYGMVVIQAFNGAGDTRTPLLISLMCLWVIQIPMAYTLAVFWNWGPFGVFISIAICEAIMTIVAIYLFRLGRWKEVKV